MRSRRLQPCEEYHEREVRRAGASTVLLSSWSTEAPTRSAIAAAFSRRKPVDAAMKVDPGVSRSLFVSSSLTETSEPPSDTHAEHGYVRHMLTVYVSEFLVPARSAYTYTSASRMGARRRSKGNHRRADVGGRMQEGIGAWARVWEGRRCSQLTHSLRAHVPLTSWSPIASRITTLHFGTCTAAHILTDRRPFMSSVRVRVSISPGWISRLTVPGGEPGGGSVRVQSSASVPAPGLG
jgi:hypothetical protein